MRKMFINFFVTGMIAFTLCACGKSEHTANNAPDASSTEEVTIAEVVEETTTESAAVIIVPETIDLAIGTTGYIITIPSDYYGAEITEKERKDDMIAYYKSDEHLMDFDVYQFAKDGKTLLEYTAEEAHQYGAKDFEKVQLGDIDATLYYSDEEYDGIQYKVANYIFETTTEFGELSFWLDGDDAYDLAGEIVSSLRYAGENYDMIGMVLDKLPQDKYYNHYNVKGDNDEVYICNYNGNDELEEGTWVYMYMIDDGMYTIEVVTELKNTESSEIEVIITNENGIQIKDLAVVLVVDTYNLQIVFANSTNSDQEFDLTKLSLQNYDGTDIKVFSQGKKPAVIGAGLEYSQHAYTISDPENLSLGDEVSFYYDGAFIHKALVTEF